jgi:hypothetical protein
MTDPNAPVPMPRGRHSFADLKTLQVGESQTYPMSAYDSLGALMARYQRRDGKRFVRRTEGDLIRVWRVA